MCGIAGIFQYQSGPLRTDALRRMNDAARHRGPDDEGYVLINTAENSFLPLCGEDSDSGISHDMISETVAAGKNFNMGMAFRRLSIVDLSPAGHQPICDGSGQYWLTFNGEIYNYVEIRDELRSLGHDFRTQSDSEVLLHAYIHWGEACLSRFIGMFAFVIYDGRNKELFGARDRFGVKPLCYYQDNRQFIWASEEKQIVASGLTGLVFDEQSVAEFLLHNQLHFGPQTFIGNIRNIPAGHCFRIRNGQLEIRSYYHLDENIHSAGLTAGEKDERFRELFRDAVRLRLRSDVPVGVALSGGLDSSGIAMMARTLLESRVRTFSVYYDQDRRFDEREFIQAVLDTGGFDPVYYTQDRQVNLDAVGQWIFQQDGPTTGASPYSAFLNYRNVRTSGIIVLLNGQGGDEILGGYPYYFKYLLAGAIRQGRVGSIIRNFHAWTRSDSLSFALRQMAGGLLCLSREQKDMIALENRKYATQDLYPGLSGDGAEALFTGRFDTPLKNAMFNTLHTTMLPHMLHWEDRNSMACSIESRVPFLDHRLVEFMYSLPDEDKIDNGLTKVILRRALRGLVPDLILDRRDKKGFGTPTDQWTSGILRRDIGDLLHSSRMESRPWWDIHAVRKALKKDRFGVHELWKIATLELFAEKFEQLHHASQSPS